VVEETITPSESVLRLGAVAWGGFISSVPSPRMSFFVNFIRPPLRSMRRRRQSPIETSEVRVVRGAMMMKMKA